jgi:hypothetical protein
VRVEGEAATSLYAPLLRSIESGRPPEGLDTVTEQLRAQLVTNPVYSSEPIAGLQGLVAFWAETGGVQWLIELARAPHRYCLGSWSSGSDRGRLFDGVDHSAGNPNRGLGTLDDVQIRHALRRYFFALPDASFVDKSAAFAAACSETLPGHEGRPRDPDLEASYLAYVLGRDGSRAHALLTPGADGRVGYVTHAGWLLASVTELAIATPFVASLKQILDIDGADHALDLVETFGADAAPLLEQILATAEARTRPKLKGYYKSRFTAAIKLAKTAP